MSNPFIEPRSLLVEQERRRRERFKVGVYISLGAMVVFLMGLLIEGCHRGQTSGDTSPTSSGETAGSTNLTANAGDTTNAAPAQPKSDTNSAPTPATASAPTTPSTQSVASASAPVPVPDQSTAGPAPSPNPTQSESESVYIIKPGDTLGRIAKAHGVSVKALRAVNGLKTDRIVAGKKLKLPPAGAPAHG